MELSLAGLVELWGSPLGHGSGSPAGINATAEPPSPIRGVSTDSRSDLTGTLFVPLVGERHDGHDFLRTALAEGGAVAAVARRDRLSVQEAEQLAAATGSLLWLVEDTQLAYQQLARLWRRMLGIPLVAVTGSAGKTTTRELIQAALARRGPVVASRGNENNDLGVPLTLLRADRSTTALVVEMGMRGPGEIERLSVCAEPDLCVITNIGTAHIGRLGSREAIGRAKCEITAGMAADGAIVIPAGDPLLENCLAAAWGGRVIRVALAEEAKGLAAAGPPPDWLGVIDPAGRSLTLQRAPQTDGGSACPGWEGRTVRLPLPGRHNARNLLLALAVARELAVPPQTLENLQVELPEGRSHRLELSGIQILDETYNASPEAVMAALDLLATEPGRHFAVLGTMLELGERSPELHEQVASHTVRLGLDGLIVMAEGEEGERMVQAAASLPHLRRVVSIQEATPVLAQWLRRGDRLLLKASRGVALEGLIPLLKQELENRLPPLSEATPLNGHPRS
jgi:UDP-N-acetylmuramoyl-tripeptide--D-alanyl-D-alanine ligase